MLLLLLLDLEAPTITDAPILEKEKENAENNTLTKTTKEQQGFGAPHYSGCVWQLHHENSIVKSSLHLTVIPSLLLCNIEVIYLSI